ncbi:hypothetical protein D1007_16695 [Hordeum vulgare]|nr:hypothetical protein D1007_16695 [Hordeum vulgare]
MVRPNQTLEEAEELAHFGIPTVTDVRMPSRWCLSIDRVPVAPVPEPDTHLFARAVGLYRARLSPKELRNLCPRPPVKDNGAQRHELWDGRNLEEVIGPHRAQVAVSAIPAPINADFAAFRRGAARPSRISVTMEAPADVHRSCLATVVQDYIHIAPVAGHPEDSPDFPGNNDAIADSIALVVDVSSNSGGNDDEDGGEAFGFDEEDLGGIDDD